MKHVLTKTLLVITMALLVFSGSALAETIPVGTIFWQVTSPGSTGEFDIVNQTGPNSSVLPDTTFPISTTLILSSLGLSVDFVGGGHTNFGPSYFTLNSDGISFDGGVIPIGGANPLPRAATLTGTFSPLTITLNDGSSRTILPTFSASIPLNSSGLADLDFAVINATTGTVGVPESASVALLGLGLAVLGLMRRRQLLKGAKVIVPVAIVALAMIVLPATSSAQVRLNSWTAPDNGVAGITYVSLTGNAFPAGHGSMPPANITVSFGSTCNGAVAATAPGFSTRNILGTTWRVQVLIPSTLNNATYNAWISSATTSDGTPYNSSPTCSMVKVTHTNPTLSACIPTSSIGLLTSGSGATGKSVAYVPNGAWSGGTTGIRVAPIEGGGTPVLIPTTDTVNSCSSNPATGQTVCTANTNKVYLLTGTTLNTTLSSASNAGASFSGGTCNNCGVAINALTNQAVIAMGFTPSPSGDAIQILDLNTNTFGAPVASPHDVSENISIDPTRAYVLSPNENSFFEIFQLSGTTATAFSHPMPGGFHDWDSAGEDCSTGIALSPGEFTNDIYLADLTQATFDNTAKTWTAPETVFTMVGTSFSAGASGLTVAPGSSHLGIVTGEFGGNSFSIFQLPATSGSGTPTILDYAFVSAIPSLPGFGVPAAGLDPHTITAYTSPVDGKAYSVMASWTSSPNFLVIIDMAAVMAAPRTAGTHTVTAAGITALVSSGAIRGVPVF